MNFTKDLSKGIIKALLFIPLLFIIAGTLDYWQGWVFCGIVFVSTTAMIYLLRNRRDLMKERMHPGPGMKSWDKVFYAFFVASYFGIFFIGPLDVAKYHWGPVVDIITYSVAVVLYIISMTILTLCMRENNWFSSVVRLQKDRKQRVVSTGPYAIVRHPGYVGAIFLGISMPLLLGSWLALIPGVVSCLALIVRTHLEDTTLQKELKGYKAYTKKTKYRLVPYVW